MSIFYLPEVKQQILQLCDEKSVANKGTVLIHPTANSTIHSRK